MIQAGLNMLSWMSEKDLNERFSTTIKLLKRIITPPMSTAESKHCVSTLRDLKTY